MSVMCFFFGGDAAMDKLWLLFLLIIVLPGGSTDSYYVMQPKEKVENHALIIWDFCLWVLSKKKVPCEVMETFDQFISSASSGSELSSNISPGNPSRSLHQRRRLSRT